MNSETNEIEQMFASFRLFVQERRYDDASELLDKLYQEVFNRYLCVCAAKAVKLEKEGVWTQPNSDIDEKIRKAAGSLEILMTYAEEISWVKDNLNDSGKEAA